MTLLTAFSRTTRFPPTQSINVSCSSIDLRPRILMIKATKRGHNDDILVYGSVFRSDWVKVQEAW